MTGPIALPRQPLPVRRIVKGRTLITQRGVSPRPRLPVCICEAGPWLATGRLTSGEMFPSLPGDDHARNAGLPSVAGMLQMSTCGWTVLPRSRRGPAVSISELSLVPGGKDDLGHHECAQSELLRDLLGRSRCSL